MRALDHCLTIYVCAANTVGAEIVALQKAGRLTPEEASPLIERILDAADHSHALMLRAAR